MKDDTLGQHISIRQESPDDLEAVFHLLKRAFHDEPFSDHREQFLVERLRKSENFIPELSLVAKMNNEIVGYILLTKAYIKNGEVIDETLALAPVAVDPRHQQKGIGSILIHHGHQKALSLQYKSIVVLGHQDYYPKFGYRQALDYDISFPFEVPENNCFAIELRSGNLNNVKGQVIYAPEFFEA